MNKQTTYSSWNVILNEYSKARQTFPPFRSAHEGYAVILEEMDELWDAIKDNNLEHAREEAVQVGAMIVAFLTEV